MKKLIFLLLIFLLLPINVSSFSSSAECGILMDQNSKRIMYEKNIHKVKSVASISKIMTAVLAIESDKLNNIVTIDEEVLKAYGSGILIGRLGSVIQGSSETTFYVLTLYFGSVGIKKIRHAMWTGLAVDLIGIISSIIIVLLFFGP